MAAAEPFDAVGRLGGLHQLSRSVAGGRGVVVSWSGDADHSVDNNADDGCRPLVPGASDDDQVSAR